MKELYEKNRVKFIGFHNAIDFESLITLKPDLVLTSGMTVARDVMYYGFPVLITYSSLNHNLESKIKYFPFMGKILNAEEIANERVTKIRNTLKEIEEKTRYLPKPKVTWGLYYNKQVITLSGDIWIAELIKISGGDYVFADNRVGANAFSLEEFITKSKDADIFFANPLLETVAKQQEAMAKSHVGLKELKAFSDKGMVVVAEPILFQDSGHIEEIALDMAALFHPELYPDRKLKYIKILEDINDLPF
jgi:iron complex transport system substrate-binding protein